MQLNWATMDLREPVMKKRGRPQDRPPLPIGFDENGEWRVYTAHLSASGTCIVDPVEMEAVYTMGFFGKGSLSRSFPSFGRKRFGAPPIVRNRQWNRRQRWLEELASLNTEPSRENIDGEEKDIDSTLESMEGEHLQDNTGALEERARKQSDGSVQEEKITTAPHEASIVGDVEVSDTSEAQDKNDERLKSAEKLESDDVEESEVPDETKKGVSESCAKVSVPQSSPEVLIEEKLASVDVKEPEASEQMKKEASGPSGKFSADGLQSLASTISVGGPPPAKMARLDVKPKTDGREDDTSDDVTMTENFPCRTIEDSNAEKFAQGNAEDSNDEDAENNSYELLVLPDTDSDTDDYLNTVRPRIERNGFPVHETLHLTFEETFFLMYGLGCLQLLHYDGSVFSNSNAWNYFQQQDKYFLQKYIVYHYFRSKGWVVKPGMKYGGDFLLYKEGPPFFHASYIVVIEVMDADTLVRDESKSLRKMTWKNLIGLERLSETISKEILFAQILWPSTVVCDGGIMPIDGLGEFTVRELLWRRWNPKRKRDIALPDEDDSDFV